MVGVFATQIIDVQRHLRVIHEAMKELGKEIHIELADPGALERHLQHQAGATRQVDDNTRQGLV